jgi:peptide chain release factor subunit 1
MFFPVRDLRDTAVMSDLALVTIADQLDRLASFAPSTFPVISLYLNTSPDGRGRDHFEPFVRKELISRAKTYALRSHERESFERDIERINHYLSSEVDPSANTITLFACAAEKEFFETLQLAPALDDHTLYVGRQPHLYPLARLYDQYRRYAVLLANTNSARLYVFGMGRRLDQKNVTSVKTNRTQMGGWSQARYQRHIENYHLHHAKDIVEALERAVRYDKIERILLAGDEVILPLLREHFTPEIAELVVDELKLDIRTPEHEILKISLEAIRHEDARTDGAKVAYLLDQYRAGALGVVGARESLKALASGQVNELLISAQPETLRDDLQDGDASLLAPETPITQPSPDEPRHLALAEALVIRARQTGARVTFIDDPSLLTDVGGVGALLRYRIPGMSTGG